MTDRKPSRYEALGVPAEFLSPNGRFKPGWDAKLKSALISTALDASMAKGKRAAAEAMLTKLGWTAHLDKSRESRAKKAAAKAKPATPAPKAEPEQHPDGVARPHPTMPDRWIANGCGPHADGHTNPDEAVACGAARKTDTKPTAPRAGKRARMPKGTRSAA